MRLSTVKGVVVGVSLAYLLDPLLGPWRRALLSQRALNLTRVARASISGSQPVTGSAIWERPMNTVHIDVDSRFSLPGSNTHPGALPQARVAGHRGFTRGQLATVPVAPNPGITSKRLRRFRLPPTSGG